MSRIGSFFRSVVGAPIRKRGFDAANSDRSSSWSPRATSIVSETMGSLSKLRAKSRDLVQNSDVAASAIRELTNATVGHGIMPQAASDSDVFNDLVDRRFEQWSNRCEPRQQMTFYSLQNQAVKAMFVSGEAFLVRVRPPKSENMPTPLWLKLYEADMVDDNLNKQTEDGGRIVQGIEFDSKDRLIAYWFFQNHPGDAFTWSARSSEDTYIRIPAEDVIHLMEHAENRPQQVRGVPRLAPVINDIREMGEYKSAELMKQRIAACFGVIFQNTEDDPDGDKALCDSSNLKIDEIYPGLIAYAPGGSTVTTVNPPSTLGYPEYVKQHLQGIGAGLGIPYAQLTGDLTKVNFSSGRMGLGGFIRKTEAVQWFTVIPGLCEKIWQWFISADYQAGNIVTAAVKVDWNTQRFPSVNPSQDEAARSKRLRNGVSTLAMEIAQEGNNPKRVFRQRQQENALLDSLDLTFDSDPRNRTLSGTNQPLYDVSVSKGKKPRKGTEA